MKDKDKIIDNVKFTLLTELSGLGQIAEYLKYEKPLTISQITLFDDSVNKLQKLADSLEYSRQSKPAEAKGEK